MSGMCGAELFPAGRGQKSAGRGEGENPRGGAEIFVVYYGVLINESPLAIPGYLVYNSLAIIKQHKPGFPGPFIIPATHI